MKLLEPNKLQEIKNKERLIELQQGTFLNKKIDGIREQIQSEESKLFVLVNDTLPFYQSKVSEVFTCKEALELEVGALLEQKKMLIKPIDDQKKYLEDLRAELLQFDLDLKNESVRISNLESMLVEKMKLQENAIRDISAKELVIKDREMQLIINEIVINNTFEEIRTDKDKVLNEWGIIDNSKRELLEIKHGNEKIAEENKKEKNRIKVAMRKLLAQEMLYANRRK